MMYCASSFNRKDTPTKNRETALAVKKHQSESRPLAVTLDTDSLGHYDIRHYTSRLIETGDTINNTHSLHIET